MKGGKKTPLGYTIIEVMIVLAVSGLMFLIAANFINGKQERTAFTQGVNEMASNIQDAIEQVTDGQYSDILLNCSFAGGVTNVSAGTNTQGANSSCIFLGKLFTFDYPDTHTYQLVSLAGGRVDASVGNPTLSSVDPAVISSLLTSQSTPQSLDVTGMSVTDTPDIGGATHASPPNSIYNFGFTQGLGTSNGVGSFQSGAQSLSLVYSTKSSSYLNNNTNTNIVGLTTAQSVTICLTDGQQLAKLVIGTNDDQLNVDVQRIAMGTPCP